MLLRQDSTVGRILRRLDDDAIKTPPALSTKEEEKAGTALLAAALGLGIPEILVLWPAGDSPGRIITGKTFVRVLYDFWYGKRKFPERTNPELDAFLLPYYGKTFDELSKDAARELWQAPVRVLNLDADEYVKKFPSEAVGSSRRVIQAIMQTHIEILRAGLELQA